MNWTMQAGALAVAGAMAVGAAAATPALAQPAPYVPGASVSVTTTNPGIGVKFGISGSNFRAREVVKLRIRTNPTFRLLKSVKTDRDGSFSTKLKLPKKYKCDQTLIARGLKSNKLASVSIVVGNPANC